MGCSNIIIGVFFLFFSSVTIKCVVFIQDGNNASSFPIAECGNRVSILVFFNRKPSPGEFLPTPFCLINIRASFHKEASKAMFNLVIYPILRTLNFMIVRYLQLRVDEHFEENGAY